MNTLPDTPALLLDAVTKRYAKTTAVDALSFALPESCVCGLVGPNGAGKTSTLRMILGLLRPTTGRLRVLGLDPAADAFRIKQLIGYVPDQHYIYPHLTTRQALTLAARVYPNWDPAEATRLAGVLELTAPGHRVKDMSRGQLAKLALVIALAHDPRLLILDEPTGGLDPIVRRAFLDVVAAHAATRRCTVLFSTHILSDVEHIADRILVLDHGRLRSDVTPDDLRRRYVKASFLFETAPAHAVEVPGALHVHRSLREWVALFPAADEGAVTRAAAHLGARDAMILPVSIDDAFVQLLTPGNGQPRQQGGPVA